MQMEIYWELQNGKSFVISSLRAAPGAGITDGRTALAALVLECSVQVVWGCDEFAEQGGGDASAWG